MRVGWRKGPPKRAIVFRTNEAWARKQRRDKRAMRAVLRGGEQLSQAAA